MLLFSSSPIWHPSWRRRSTWIRQEDSDTTAHSHIHSSHRSWHRDPVRGSREFEECLIVSVRYLTSLLLQALRFEFWHPFPRISRAFAALTRPTDSTPGNPEDIYDYFYDQLNCNIRVILNIIIFGSVSLRESFVCETFDPRASRADFIS